MRHGEPRRIRRGRSGRAVGQGYPGRPPVALAHRGGAVYAPNRGIENSLAAFRAAVALGYVHLETDVHLTSDRVLVAMHDERLDRVAGVDAAVAETPYERLRDLRLGGREPIPTLADLLDAFPSAVFNIDLKAPGTGAALAALLREASAEGKVCVGSFSPRRLWSFRRRTRGRVPTSAGPLGTAWLRFAPSGLTRWVHSPGVAYQVPRRRRVLGVDVEVVTPGFVEAAHRVGAQVHVWTIDDPAEMAELLDLGVDGIVSDAVDVLADVLAARGHWPPAR